MTHNARAGSRPTSSHINGSAADFWLGAQAARWGHARTNALIERLLDAGEIRLRFAYNITGGTNSVVHLDVDWNKAGRNLLDWRRRN